MRQYFCYFLHFCCNLISSRFPIYPMHYFMGWQQVSFFILCRICVQQAEYRSCILSIKRGHLYGKQRAELFLIFRSRFAYSFYGSLSFDILSQHGGNLSQPRSSVCLRGCGGYVQHFRKSFPADFYIICTN